MEKYRVFRIWDHVIRNYQTQHVSTLILSGAPSGMILLCALIIRDYQFLPKMLLTGHHTDLVQFTQTCGH